MTYQVFLPFVSLGPAPVAGLQRGIDVSAYQINVPWSELVEHGLNFCVIKGNQLTATWNHVAQARAAGVSKVGLYFWLYPTVTSRWQVDEYMLDVEECKPDFLALDIEQYWPNTKEAWEAYYDYIGGKISESAVPKVSSAQISNTAKAVAEGLKAQSGLELLPYTGTWFVEDHSPELLSWVGEYSLWWAHYYDRGKGKYNIDWPQFEQFPEGSLTLKEPDMPAGLTWKMWQFTSRWIYPGQKYPWDTNLMKKEL